MFNSLEVGKIYRKIFRSIEITSVVGHNKKRVGGDADGGYVMIDNFHDIDYAYSLGISNEVSWDIEMANLGIPVFQYDDSIDASPAKHKLFIFLKDV